MNRFNHNGLTKAQLSEAKPENLLRFARWLGLKNLDRMSHEQRVRLVYWMITRHAKNEWRLG